MSGQVQIQADASLICQCFGGPPSDSTASAVPLEFKVFLAEGVVTK